MSTANTDISLGEQLRASFETAQNQLNTKCIEIIKLNCRDRASKGYGFCELEWKTDFYGMNIDHELICQLVEQLGGFDVEECNHNKIVLRWIKDEDIEKIKKKIKKPKLPTIPEEKSESMET